MHYDWYGSYRNGKFSGDGIDRFDETYKSITELKNDHRIIVYQEKHSTRGLFSC